MPKVRVKKSDLVRLFKKSHERRASGDESFSETAERFEQYGRDGGFNRFGEDSLDYQATDGFSDPREASAKSKERGGVSGRRGQIKSKDPRLVKKVFERILTTPPTSGGMFTNRLLDDESVRERKALCDMQDAFVVMKMRDPGYNPKESIYYQDYAYLRDRLISKVVTTGGSGTGAEFIPNTLSGELIDLFRQATVLASIMPHINMPTSPFKLPLEGADVMPYYVTETSDDNHGTHSASAIPARTPPTSQVTFTAKGLKVRGKISSESDEDAVFSTIDYTRNKLVAGLANGEEDALINGDTAGTHMDGDVTASNDHRKAIDGLRKLAGNPGDAQNHDMSNAKLSAKAPLNVIIQQGKFASMPAESSVLLSPLGLAHLAGDDNLITVDKMGARATLLNGQVGSLFGRSVVVSGYLRDDLDATGNYNASTTDRSLAVVVHRPSFAIGDRRSVTVESMKDILTDSYIVVLTYRFDFQRVQSASTGHQNVGYIYNISTTATFS